MSEHTPFLEIFPGCEALASVAGGLEKALHIFLSFLFYV